MSIHLSHLSHGHGWVDCIDTDLVGAKLKSCHPEIFLKPIFWHSLLTWWPCPERPWWHSRRCDRQEQLVMLESWHWPLLPAASRPPSCPPPPVSRWSPASRWRWTACNIYIYFFGWGVDRVLTSRSLQGWLARRVCRWRPLHCSPVRPSSAVETGLTCRGQKSPEAAKS